MVIEKKTTVLVVTIEKVDNLSKEKKVNSFFFSFEDVFDNPLLFFH